MILTAQQKQAMIMIEKFIADKDSQVFILKGYAGTGKTTLIRSIADYLSTQSLHIQLMAPTGRAAKILRSKLPNYGASTIHRGIYNFSHLIVEESEGTLKYIFPLKDNHERCIYIIDEASMISSRESKNELFQFGTGVLIKDLLSYARLNFGGKVIFVGDPMQLPPVGDDCSVALDETYFDILEMNVYSYELTDIVRQDKNSCILANATILRELIRKKERNRLVFKKKEHEVMDIGAMEVAKKYCEDPEQSSAIVCFSNQQAADYNTAIRNIIFPETNHVAVGDKFITETDANDTELLFFFQNDENIKYKIDYHPSLESLKMLHSRMISLCDECGIILTNVVEEHYQLVYYMKASGNYAAITFFFNGKGFINYAAPLSDIGEADIKLSQLIEKLT